LDRHLEGTVSPELDQAIDRWVEEQLAASPPWTEERWEAIKEVLDE
jgi:hypothetical protein